MKKTLKHKHKHKHKKIYDGAGAIDDEEITPGDDKKSHITDIVGAGVVGSNLTNNNPPSNNTPIYVEDKTSGAGVVENLPIYNNKSDDRIAIIPQKSKRQEELENIKIDQKSIPVELRQLTEFTKAESAQLDKFTQGVNVVAKFGIKGGALIARTLVLSIQILYNNVVRDTVQLRSDLLEVVKLLGKQEKIKDGNGTEITDDAKFDTLIEMANSIKNVNTFYNYGDIYVLFSKLKLFYNNSVGKENLITNAIDDSSEYFSYLFKSEEAKKASEAQRNNKSTDKRSLFYLFMAFLFNILLLNVFAILVLKQMGITMPYDIVKFLGSVGSGLFFSSKGMFGGLLTTFSTTAKTSNASPELTSMIFQVLLSMI